MILLPIMHLMHINYIFKFTKMNENNKKKGE